MTIINKEDFKIKKELNRPILSLDYGESKVGIAISDPNCTIALPSEVYKRNKKAAKKRKAEKMGETRFC